MWQDQWTDINQLSFAAPNKRWTRAIVGFGVITIDFQIQLGNPRYILDIQDAFPQHTVDWALYFLEEFGQW